MVEALPLLRSTARLARRAFDSAVSALYPQGCHVCGDVVRDLRAGVACESCWADSTVTPLWNGPGGCEYCGAIGAEDCATGQCVVPGVALIRSGGVYTGALRANILDLKRRAHVCGLLGSTITGAALLLPPVDVVVPVPLHPSRRAQRGHNQAELLAAKVARALELASDAHALARLKELPRLRGGRNREERLAAAKGAFQASQRIVTGKSILLVDDVLTTGATLAASAQALRTAGSIEVYAVTAARAGRVSA